MLAHPQHTIVSASAFDLQNVEAYARWREQKLAGYPASVGEILVEVANPHALTPAEGAAIRQACARANMAVYTLKQAGGQDKGVVEDLGRQFGLCRLDVNLYADDDGISALQVVGEKRQFEYIPYSNKAISWHTDGYYNTAERRVRGMVLHCVSPAAAGGENALLDHEMIYLQLRDLNPDYIAALMHPEVMTIPANVEGGVEIRPAQSGPVFSVDPEDGHLHMRYTARTRSIEWRQDALTQEAVHCLEALLAAESDYIFHYRLQAGQGIICNNVLHNRTAFTDDESTGQKRLFYRARYYDRVS